MVHLLFFNIHTIIAMVIMKLIAKLKRFTFSFVILYLYNSKKFRALTQSFNSNNKATLQINRFLMS